MFNLIRIQHFLGTWGRGWHLWYSRLQWWAWLVFRSLPRIPNGGLIHIFWDPSTTSSRLGSNLVPSSSFPKFPGRIHVDSLRLFLQPKLILSYLRHKAVESSHCTIISVLFHVKRFYLFWEIAQKYWRLKYLFGQISFVFWGQIVSETYFSLILFKFYPFF